MKHSCTHWRPCLGPASVPLHSSALLTWGGQHGHHHYGSQQAERGHSVRTRRGRVGRDLGGYGTAYPAIYWPGYVAGIGRAIHYRAGEQLLSPPGLQLSATSFCLLLC